MRRAALIGFGAMARKVREVLAAAETPTIALAGVLEVPEGLESARRVLGRSVRVVENLQELLALHPDIVAECATQKAVRQHGAAVLRAGIDLVVISVGALADPALLAELHDAARESGARLIIPSGALGAVDALAAARLGELYEVRQTLSKPPRSWKGTPAEKDLDLDTIERAAEVFRGSAREAATRYPQNANVAALVALAGVGFDKSEVTLLADPELTGPVHRIEAKGSFGSFAIEVRGVSLPDNPKSSTLAALSLARALLNTAGTVIV